MRDDEDGNDYKSLQDMYDRDMRAGLMGLMSQEGIIDNELRRIFDYVERTVSESD